MSQFRLIDWTPWGLPGGLPSAEPASTVPEPQPDVLEFLVRAQRVPTFSRSYAFHHASPGDGALARTLRGLQGKFAVVNPALVLPLPSPTVRRARRHIHQLQHSDASGLGREPGAAGTLALYEAAPRVEHEARAVGTSDPARNIKFFGALRYRLVITSGNGDHPAGLIADPVGGSSATSGVDLSRPIPWFDIALLTPDADALRQMVPITAHFYRLITGRLGARSSDSYWYLDAWDRFREQGQIIGCVVPSLVEHGHAGGASAMARAAAPPPEPAPFADPGGFAPSRWQGFTPNFDRRGFVPPGYCLIRYFATIEITVGHAERQHAAA